MSTFSFYMAYYRERLGCLLIGVIAKSGGTLTLVIRSSMPLSSRDIKWFTNLQTSFRWSLFLDPGTSRSSSAQSTDFQRIMDAKHYNSVTEWL